MRIGLGIGKRGTGSAPSASAPVTYINPAIIGTPTEGVAVSYTNGVYGGYPTPTLTREWFINGVTTGITTATYTPGTGDVGDTLTVRETATNGSGSVSADSAGVVVVAGSGAPTGSELLLENDTTLLTEDDVDMLLES